MHACVTVASSEPYLDLNWGQLNMSSSPQIAAHLKSWESRQGGRQSISGKHS